MIDIEQIKIALANFPPKPLPDDGSKRGAVLVPIYEKADELFIIFTKRTEHLPYHKGQISFPGGKLEEQDCALMDCALRETKEEIGLIEEKITIIGELNQIKTNSSNILLSAFVGLIDYPFKLQKNDEEVEEIIEIPLKDLLNDSQWEQKEILVGRERTEKVWFFYYHDKIVWGATAKIIMQFLSLIR
jgi:8-oxo-dGTP pyrophosphatase MutT (NUDIX family)